jgi:23S rRNA pseudouridine1911/1915/1917 synthase
MMSEPNGAPYTVYSGDGYAVLYKPPFMHCAPLKRGEAGTLAAWYAARVPAFLSVRGRKEIEGGLLHRLDYETEGLVFAALTQEVMDVMLRQQAEGLFVKEYEAAVSGAGSGLSGFPPCQNRGFDTACGCFFVESGFRRYGPGGKAVRPVPATEVAGGGRIYRTEVLGAERAGGAPPERGVWRLRLTRGFRHQIRCHLAWLGFPIVGDRLYGGEAGRLQLALKAACLSFDDPVTGERMTVSLTGVKEGYGG